MNIIEAALTGKKFKRKSWTAFYSSEYVENVVFNLEDILADDWEVETEKAKYRKYFYRYKDDLKTVYESNFTTTSWVDFVIKEDENSETIELLKTEVMEF
jgi:hypothetical protein